ncbi:hypothetical protein RNJ44_04444 [Nakaseomyces bracarensis]|uniref:MIF4G domain-containing protein n=1 Tax=Nakaseomyces bracarensis TaxID=273131 RepID=A0ABR4NUY1_9SACH
MFNRKRKADFEEDESYRDFRPHVPKRQRVPPVVQLCKEMMPDIRTIGESVKAFEEDIQFLSEAIVNEFGHEEYFNNALLLTFRSVVLEQPQKLPAISLLTMVVNTKNEAAGKGIINYFFKELQNYCNDSVDSQFSPESSDTGPWNKIKLVLRFLATLSPMLLNRELISLFKDFLQLAVELNNLDSSKRNALAEAIYTNTLINIPYLFFYNKNDEELKSMVTELLEFAEGNFNMKNTNINLLREYNEKTPYESAELVQLILPNVKKSLMDDMKELDQLFPEWKHLLTEQAGDQGFNDPLQLPSVEELGEFMKLDRNMGSVDSMWHTPRYVFKVYTPTEANQFETVIPITTYSGQLFNDIIIDIVESLEFNRKEVARQVVSLDIFFRKGIFAEPGISIAQLTNIYEENPLATTFKIEDLAIEAIISLIFKLPDVSQPFAYFYTLLVEICQNSPKAIAPVFGRAFRFFYNHLKSLDFELRMRYLDWFSIQMSNFNFSWKWNEWEQDSITMGQSFYDPNISFIRNLIRKELRLTSNPIDVEESLPSEFKKYLDSSYINHSELVSYYQSLFTNFTVEPEQIKKNDFYFKNASFPMEGKVRNLLDYIHKPNNNREIAELENILTSIKEEHGSTIVDFNKFTIILIVQALLESGSRSLSHANKYISDLKPDFEHILQSIDLDQDQKEYLIIEAVIRYWNANSQNGYLIVDAFKFSDLVSSRSILNFALSEDLGRNFGLVEGTAIETIFRTLSHEITLGIEHADDFEFTFERLCLILNSTVQQLNIQNDEDIDMPQFLESNGIDGADAIINYDLKWKYYTAVTFIKSLLRKYASKYRTLSEKFIAGMEGAVSHQASREQLLTWIREMEEI